MAQMICIHIFILCVEFCDLKLFSENLIEKMKK